MGSGKDDTWQDLSLGRRRRASIFLLPCCRVALALLALLLRPTLARPLVQRVRCRRKLQLVKTRLVRLPFLLCLVLCVV